MTDRELLELAAKAAGYTNPLYGELSGDAPVLYLQTIGIWNPLGDDGDEARLEAALQLHVTWHPAQETVTVGTATITDSRPYGSDRQAARRYAGVCVAAEIGKVMP